jgi:hypothetical protein
LRPVALVENRLVPMKFLTPTFCLRDCIGLLQRLEAWGKKLAKGQVSGLLLPEPVMLKAYDGNARGYPPRLATIRAPANPNGSIR